MLCLSYPGEGTAIKVFSFMWGIWPDCLGLRIISIQDQKIVLHNFLSILMLFTMRKIKVVLKILIIAHRCQICNKKYLLKKIKKNIPQFPRNMQLI